MPRKTARTALQIATDLDARVRAEEAKLKLSRLKLAQRANKLRGVALSTYEAAARNRTNRDWQARPTSADGTILPDRLTVDARARQMVRDEAYAASVVRSFRRNVIGRGIWPAPQARVNGIVQHGFNELAKARWYDWARRRQVVDMEKRRTFARIQAWAISELVTVGEGFVVMSVRHDPRRGFNLALQCIEAEQLDRFKLQHTDDDGTTREVRNGVEVDSYGAAVAYWFYHRHPYDIMPSHRPSPMSLDSYRVLAERVCHVYDPDRVRQTRGISRFASVLTRLRNTSTYDHAQLLAAKAEACIGMMITSDPATQDSIGLPTSVEGGEGGDGGEAGGDYMDALQMQPLMVARLSPGEDVKAFTPERPGNLYEPFMGAQLRAVAAGTGLSYEQVVRDFTNGTYSSQRQSMLEDRREFEPLQDLIIDQLCMPVYEEWMTWELLTGRLVAPGFMQDPDAWTYAQWSGQGWAWISPKDEADANETALEQDLDTHERIAAERGLDWREVADQRALEREYKSRAAERAKQALDAEEAQRRQASAFAAVVHGAMSISSA